MDNDHSVAEEETYLPGVTVVLIQDVAGFMQKGKIYGKVRDRATVISHRGNVLILEGKMGRYPAPTKGVRKTV